MKFKLWLLGILTAFLAACVIWCCSAYTIIGGYFYDRDITAINLSDIDVEDPQRVATFKNLQLADLRNTGLTVEGYEKIREALPECEILWNVPFQGDYLDPNTTKLTVSSITEEEIAVLAYFPQLETINMKNCTDVDAILKVLQQYPQCTVQWMVPFQGQSISCDTVNLTISSLSDEDLAMIPYFTSLESVNARKCGDLDALMKLREAYPDLKVSWLVPIMGKSYNHDTGDLSLENADAQELLAQLKYLPNLETVALTGEVPDQATMLTLKETYPEVAFGWDFQLCGVTVNTNDKEIDLSEIQMESVEEVENSLPLFNQLEKVVMYKCGISSEDMDALWKRHPEIRFVWGAYIGGHYLRTDEISFMPWKLGYTRDGRRGMNNSDAAELKYMVDLICIDMGHNDVNDLTFLYNMPNVEYLMVCCSGITDITPIGSLKKLKYLELWENKITDLSPLAGCTALEDINFTFVRTDDLTPLLGLTNLKNIWFNGRSFPEEQVQMVYDTFPDANVQSKPRWPTSLGWRRIPNYYAQRDILGLFYLDSAGEGKNQ